MTHFNSIDENHIKTFLMVRKERRYSRSMLRCLSKPDAHFMGENHIPNHTPNRKIGFLGVFGVFGRIGGKEDKEGKGPAPGIASGFKSADGSPEGPAPG